MAIATTACGPNATTSPDRKPTPCPSSSPGPVDRSLIPGDLPSEMFGDISSTRVSKGFLTVEATTDVQIVELDPALQRDLLDNGYQLVSHDNEGFEAEIFFARGAGTTGIISLHDDPCHEGVVRLRLVYGSKATKR